MPERECVIVKNIPSAREMYTKQQIEEANSMDIVQVARDLGLDMVQRGSRFFIRCPWHEDSRPSCQVGGARNICHCYSCGETAGPIKLIMKAKECGFLEAMGYIRPLPLTNSQPLPLTPSTKTGRRKPLPLTPSPKWEGGAAAKDGGNEEGDGFATLFHLCRKGDDAWLEAKGDDVLAGMEAGTQRRLLDNFYPSMDNSLSRCLLHWFPRDVVEWVTNRYVLGCWTDRSFVWGTTFPNIDTEGRCLNVKVQEYETDPQSPQFGHRKGNTTWLGKGLAKPLPLTPSPKWEGEATAKDGGRMKEDGGRMKGDGEKVKKDAEEEGKKNEKCKDKRHQLHFNRSSLFGAHLINLPPTNAVAPPSPLGEGVRGRGCEGSCVTGLILVESPKNAIVGACWRPEWTWVAVGNKGGLRREVLEPLRGRDVLVFPDKDAIAEWGQKIREMSDLANFRLCTSWAEEIEDPKGDIADWILSQQIGRPTAPINTTRHCCCSYSASST